MRMLRSKATRIALALAFVLAGWSPGWCCCALGASPCSGSDSGRSDSGVGSSCCEAPLGAQSRIAEREDVEPGCCGPISSEGDEQSDQSDRSSCGCGSHARELDRTRVAVLPDLQEDQLRALSLQLAIPDHLTPPSAPQIRVHGPPQETAAGKVRAESLRALHVLLTV